MARKSDNTIHCSKDVLVWARKVRGLTQAEAAKELGITEGLLKAIEEGEEHPTLALFNAMISVYKQPESILLLASPPNTPPLPQDYRTSGSRSTKLSPDTRLIIREVQEVQHFISELVNDELVIGSAAQVAAHGITARAPDCSLVTHSRIVSRATIERYGAVVVVLE